MTATACRRNERRPHPPPSPPLAPGGGGGGGAGAAGRAGAARPRPSRALRTRVIGAPRARLRARTPPIVHTRPHTVHARRRRPNLPHLPKLAPGSTRVTGTCTAAEAALVKGVPRPRPARRLWGARSPPRRKCTRTTEAPDTARAHRSHLQPRRPRFEVNVLFASRRVTSGSAHSPSSVSIKLYCQCNKMCSATTRHSTVAT